MRYSIYNRYTGHVRFTAEIDCADDTPRSVKVGLAVKWALKTNANLRCASLRFANLMGANLADADLKYADLKYADLKYADLKYADLRCANLADANLMGANLADADLKYANLRCADLMGANLADANGVINAGTPNGWCCVGWLRDGWLSIRVGCHDKRLDEGREYWAGKDDRREVLAALDYVEAVAKLRGWTVTK